MTRKFGSFIRLEHALSETRDALDEVIQVLKETSIAPSTRFKKPFSRSTDIIPQYVFEVYFERRQRGELLDQRHRELWLMERELVSACNNPENADRRDKLLSELKIIQQAMTNIEQQLYSQDDEL